MEKPFLQPQEYGEGQLREKGSRFLAFVFPVDDQVQIEDHLDQLRRQYHDASHHCYAWRLGKRAEESLANDDGEPAHSAGTPILAAIRSARLTNVLAVVVRYFGGTKLGVRGLIEAYRQSTAAVIENLPVEPLIPQVVFSFSFAYDQTSQIERILHPFEVDELEAKYTDHCFKKLAVASQHFPKLAQHLQGAGFEFEVISRD